MRGRGDTQDLGLLLWVPRNPKLGPKLRAACSASQAQTPKAGGGEGSATNGDGVLVCSHRGSPPARRRGSAPAGPPGAHRARSGEAGSPPPPGSPQRGARTKAAGRCPLASVHPRGLGHPPLAKPGEAAPNSVPPHREVRLRLSGSSSCCVSLIPPAEVPARGGTRPSWGPGCSPCPARPSQQADEVKAICPLCGAAHRPPTPGPSTSHAPGASPGAPGSRAGTLGAGRLSEGSPGSAR